jgi:hypothetical protein
MNFNFSEVLARAWKITWKYKILWIFGILAGCARGGGGSSSGGTGWSGGSNGSGYSPFDTSETERIFNQFSEWLTSHWWVVALIILGVLLLVLLSIFLGTIGRIGLIRGTLQAEEGTEKLSFGELFRGSMPYFWRIFGLTFLIGLIFTLLMLPIILFGVFTAGIGFLCILPLICLFVPVSIAVYLIVELANVAIVKENIKLWDGFRRGWELIRANVGTIIIMGLILLVISFVVGIVIAIPAIMIILPSVLAFGANQAQSFTPLLIGGLCFVLLLPVMVLASGVLNTFTGVSWTLTYLRLTNKPEAASTLIEANA